MIPPLSKFPVLYTGLSFNGHLIGRANLARWKSTEFYIVHITWDMIPVLPAGVFWAGEKKIEKGKCGH